MEFIIRPLSNKIEYTNTRGHYKGKHSGRYIVKSISVVLTSDKPEDLMLMSKYRKRIERAIVNELNSNVRGKKNDYSRN